MTLPSVAMAQTTLEDVKRCEKKLKKHANIGLKCATILGQNAYEHDNYATCAQYYEVAATLNGRADFFYLSSICYAYLNRPERARERANQALLARTPKSVWSLVQPQAQALLGLLDASHRTVDARVKRASEVASAMRAQSVRKATAQEIQTGLEPVRWGSTGWYGVAASALGLGLLGFAEYSGQQAIGAREQITSGVSRARYNALVKEHGVHDTNKTWSALAGLSVLALGAGLITWEWMTEDEISLEVGMGVVPKDRAVSMGVRFEF